MAGTITINVEGWATERARQLNVTQAVVPKEEDPKP
jgi:hypothetical protein